jgi:hypothetical protein
MSEPTETELSAAVAWCEKNGWDADDGDPLARALFHLSSIRGGLDGLREVAEAAGLSLGSVALRGDWFAMRDKVVRRILKRAEG